MSRPVRFRPEAEAELIQTRTWYEDRRDGLGAEFSTEVARVVDHVAERPASFPMVHGDTRRAVLNRFPYAIYFRQYGDEIIVLAVYGRQDPRGWKSRR